MQPPPTVEILSIANGTPVATEICVAMSVQGDMVQVTGCQLLFQDSHFLARLMAVLTCVGAVPPIWLRLFIDPSKVNTAKTSLSINWENSCNSGRVSAPKSWPFLSAKRTACATVSCASRKGTPF